MRSKSVWLMMLVILSLAPATPLLLSGCGQKAEYSPDEAAKPSLWRFFRVHRGEKAPAGALTGEAALSGAAAGKAGAFAWTETPSLDKIPAGQVTGMINGKPFTAKMVRIEHSMGELSLVFSDVAPDKPTGTVMKNTGIELSLKLPEGKPGQMIKARKDSEDPKKTGHAWFHYEMAGDKGPMSVNPEWAAALQISEWKMAKDATDPAVVGSIKGKIALCFGDEKKSWIAGDFSGLEMK